MREKVSVITNNFGIYLAEQDRFVDGTALEVFRFCRDLIHQGHRLISHPLAGSVKPNESPYRSVVVTRRGEGRVDPQSLALIEQSVRVAEQMLQQQPYPAYSERVLADFRYLDQDLLKTALNSLPGWL